MTEAEIVDHQMHWFTVTGRVHGKENILVLEKLIDRIKAEGKITGLDFFPDPKVTNVYDVKISVYRLNEQQIADEDLGKLIRLILQNIGSFFTLSFIQVW